MILIVDSGSTKCDWIVVDKNGNQLFEKIRTKGMNPAINSEKKLLKVLKKNEVLKENRKKVTHVFFYGAGCGTDRPRLMLKNLLQEFFSNAEQIEVKEDTYAAVYATINKDDEAAVVCILGTGSNCSYYDGATLHQRVKSLGYSIMDDAAGNYFGKQLLRDYFFKHMPEDLRVSFADKYNMDTDFIKYNLYKQPNPNAYLASFAEFMVLNKDAEYMRNLILDGIRVFTKNMIMQFKEELQQAPVHFAGSIAFFSKDEIHQVAKEYDFTVGNIVRRPIEKLVTYHTSKL
jgi:N-acetylglucosamine kinase-like BadF-type ATPase